MCELHMTPTQLREELDNIVRYATAGIEYLDLYGGEYSDDLSEEVVDQLRRIEATARVARQAHRATHKRDTEFTKSVVSDLNRITVTGTSDVEVPGSLWSETAALEDRFFGDLIAGPDEEDES